ncbi:fibronectin type III domain-containing protein [Lactococcus formosensis]|uniref:fibronectin type III domain-containing protein n=1 Tax=Lactococcus formosensis TaxID=1281486 RepID=UPI002435E952|nr:fibronectin type III domain-containing protein [Lactococcus formosensis]MDG6113748.1 fibronectin type III domain-containing protein [Lactococcus formosensis]MDG6122261.1 fibronectin type III domain-containing protein [Lactococcus formosensis]MDG6151867.1 fibronectin type III domain-containing protein [Lactococcus formosensis]MDG6174913.1 fibronectin type III domain-containing protein [Lactococcus formosensis]MDG6181231.1 fibronectin type III domain-containing protein [Lactococcus formosensi
MNIFRSQGILPASPQNVTGAINSDGSVKLEWNAVSEAQAYIVHYGNANQSDPHDAIFMGYTESNTWTLALENVPELQTGDKIYFYVQAYKQKGQGSTEVEKARYLHDGDFIGSSWSDVTVLIKK